MEPAVSLLGLTRDFDDLRAVDGLTFDVAHGELFGIMGPDGAGKTTTLRMLAGVLRPTSGDARLAGVSVARHRESVKRHIAYMSQRFGLYNDLTVRENLDFYANLYRVPRAERHARLERLYAFSGLGPFEERLAGQLSGGMKQKLGLSCALIHEPEIMLLDEPTFGVDPISRRDLWLIVHEMVARNVTVIVSTAYLDEAERCDRVVVLHQGRAVALDRPDALQERLREKVLAVRTDRPREARDRLRGHPSVRQAVLFGDLLHVTLRTDAQEWPAVRADLAAAGVDVLAEGIVEASLEDVFIDLTRRREVEGE
ncbi:MAG: multidrug ABC transporter ATP-binding protein [Gemmatimonas sp. SM23_52]|nr:MAG: multidrug ABC transporter ATP-binding protein [Gemmatimonas sp. SM23_52]